jgi:feruloyl esterase
MSFMTPVNPTDMSALGNRGGKVLAYHGVSDPIFSVNDTEAWFKNLKNASTMGRFFRVPGMGHCSGGPAPDQFDALTPLVNWVEKGVAPEQIIASARGAGNAGGVNADVPASWAPNRTRPLCAYPKVARYGGTGSIDDAANFSCK